jgi:hypothetical protein
VVIGYTGSKRRFKKIKSDLLFSNALKNVCMPNTSKLLFKSDTAIGFYVKTMSAHGSHLGWRSWSPDTFLKVYYPSEPLVYSLLEIGNF